MEPNAINRVDLQRPRGARVLKHLAIGIVFGIGLFIAGSAIYGMAEDTNGSEWVLLLGLLLVSLAEALRRANLHQLKSGAIEIAGAKLMIEYPPLLRAPLELDLRNVRVAAIAEAPQGADPGFPVYGYSNGPDRDNVADDLSGSPDWLPVRALGLDEAPPNAILLFEAPVMTPGVRRVSPNGPRDTEALGGIAVNVADAGQARRLFDAFGLRSRIHEEDLERLARIAAGEIQVEPQE